MRVIVQKFGGTSVATPEYRQMVVNKIKIAQKEGYRPVIVVSAMGRKGAPYATDTLISLAKDTFEGVAKRELDLVMSCGEIISAVTMAATLQAEGYDAVMLTGGQAGIITDDNYNNGRILRIDPSNLISLLKQDRVPVVCGFQGSTVDGEFTTLGRGGSDTTAAALGAALNADLIEIYTDVDGIMTADPRIVKNAKILDYISYGEVCQMAHQGAKVIHPRAVEIAMQKNIPLVVKSTFSDAPGTLIANSPDKETHENSIKDRIATGVTYLANLAQVRINLEKDTTHSESFRIFKALAENSISVDLINVHPGHIMFTVAEDVAEKAQLILINMGYEVEIELECAKVSVVGGGMREVPGVMANFAEALSNNNIRIFQTVDSHTSISVLVKNCDVNKAVTALHEKFSLADE